MDNDVYAGAACAASDLTARLAGELQRARRDLSAAEVRYSRAVERALAAGQPVPFAPRRALVRSRRQLSALARVLAGLPICDDGGRHVELA